MNRPTEIELNQLGLTRDPERIAKACAYREVMLADGWDVEQSYPNEPIEKACKLTREGFLFRITTRDFNEHGVATCSMSCWGPDSMSIKIPMEYSWEAIQAGVRHCNKCDADGVETTRYSFAGRCCLNCLPQARKDHEYPGWSN